MSTEIWTKGEGKELHMTVEESAGVQIVTIEASLFRVILTELGWMPLTEPAAPDRFVHITND